MTPQIFNQTKLIGTRLFIVLVYVWDEHNTFNFVGEVLLLESTEDSIKLISLQTKEMKIFR